MIVGDPFNFAVQFDMVEQWNSDEFWRNGIFSLYINGVRLPNILDVTELRASLACYIKLEDIVASNGLEGIAAEYIYEKTNSYLFGDGTDYIDGVYDLTCTMMADAGCHAYWIGCAESEIFVWSLNGGENIESASLPSGTFYLVASELKKILEDDLKWR
ncbi:Imm42 family immunity protein [Pseudomonas sp. Marseille-Q5115]|uniref:Imm42 family immunity protein n=1 Tax=Pseudomonas sp. Marseille-Q5115 TaxID=2866593 RepID=UPI001CE45788|nr:Imm42 family immunity protein [Pseudomonas sp. Marseille-Q5115]